jgi:hypothetical protein
LAKFAKEREKIEVSKKRLAKEYLMQATPMFVERWGRHSQCEQKMSSGGKVAGQK